MKPRGAIRHVITLTHAMIEIITIALFAEKPSVSPNQANAGFSVTNVSIGVTKCADIGSKSYFKCDICK